MQDKAILAAGLTLEVVKLGTPLLIEKAGTWLDSMATALDDKYGQPYPCSGDWMCLREGVRHKAGCPGRTVPIEQYTRALK